jgi:hypothetical protein
MGTAGEGEGNGAGLLVSESPLACSVFYLIFSKNNDNDNKSKYKHVSKFHCCTPSSLWLGAFVRSVASRWDRGEATCFSAVVVKLRTYSWAGGASVRPRCPHN